MKNNSILINSIKKEDTSLKLLSRSLFVFLLFTFHYAGSQTVHINPGTNGGFESGLTFGLNGWTATTGSTSQNQWVCNSGASAGYSGLRCAYISNNTLSLIPPHAYTLTTTRRTHLYRNVTIPSGETTIELSFDWIGRGEGTNDRLRVWITPTSFTPTYGTPVGPTGSAPTGRILIGDYNNQASWTNTTVNLPTNYAGNSFRLIFEWVNNNGSGTQPPAAIDNISLTSAVPPVNNDCSNATSLAVNQGLTCTSTTNGTSVNATQSLASCSGTADDDVWYSFVATSSRHFVTVSAGTMANPVLEVFSGNCGSLTSISCRNANSDNSDEVASLTGLSIGNTYFVRIHSADDRSGEGTFTVCVTSINDECSDAIALTVNPDLTCTATTSGTTQSASQSFAGCSGTADDDVWYSFVATSTNHTVTVSAGTLVNPVLQIFSGSCGTLTSVLCRNVFSNNNDEVATFTTLTVGATYYVRVHSAANGTGQGTFSLCVTTIPNPVNDNCSNAITLPVNPDLTCTLTTSGTTQYASQSQAGCTGTADDDVWYSFTATSSYHFVTVSSGTLVNPVLQVFRGNCGSLTSVVCRNANNDNSDEVATLTGLTVGDTYFVRVYNLANGTGQGTFNLCVTTIPNALNDNCSNAIALTVNPDSSCSYTTSSTSEYASQSQTGCSGTADDDVWFSFVALSDIQAITVTPSTMDNVVFQVFSGSCGSLTSIICRNSTSGSSVETANATGLTIGNTYYVRVYSSANLTSQGTFSICVNSINDNCSGAFNVAVNSNSTCTVSTTGTTIGATQSQSGCAGSADDDVWFSFVATSTLHTVTVNPNTLSDAVLQIFNGSCGSLSSIVCQDLTASNSPESATVTGLTIGATYYFRVYSYGNNSGNRGTFSVCVTTPENPCDSVTTISGCGTVTNATIESGAGLYPNSACENSTPGLERIFSYTPTMSGTFAIQQLSSYTTINYQYKSTATGCNNTGWACIQAINGAQTSYTFYMSAGTTYYIMIDPQNSIGGSVSFQINCLTTPCSAGEGIGTSALGCPSVTSGGLGLSGANPDPIACDAPSTCTTLEASYLKLGQTTNYTVQSIDYAPPYQFECLANPVSVNIDDVWSSEIYLPFSFCFFGNTYNSCLIGSNGTLTFDTSNASGYAGWQFANNLPSTVGALFNNTIYGVYHDIDPSKGGTVGWELIYLDSGCRALVASWHDIPMYSNTCNSILYTGMMVLYEDSNVIEVYIEEKNVCSTWNGGNAVVGIQNSTGSQAIVAPSRNSLSTNWTVTNEAWRFVPSGDPITTLEWFEGSGTSGPMIGTTDTIEVCPLTTTTYTARVTYELCNGSTVVETDETEVQVIEDKIWNGSIDLDWDKPNNWTPAGVPNSLDCVTIPVTPNNPEIDGTEYEGLAKNLRVLNGASLTIKSDNAITVSDWVEVQPTALFEIENDASLVQINNATNTGNILYRRNAFIRKLDYVYWSSPVTPFHVNAVSTGTPASARFFWNTTLANTNAGIGTWSNANENMIPGKGYIVRGPNSFDTTIQQFTANFIGVPNNGNISVPIARGSYTGPDYAGTNGVVITNMDDNFNLIGNPYPSAIRYTDFMAANPNLEGSIRVWTHGTLPNNSTPNPFYSSFVYNYTSADYIIHNGTGTLSGPETYDGFIPAGQSFFVIMNDGAATTSTANFTNSMRVRNNNAQFYRNANLNERSSVNEHNRIWVDLVAQNGTMSRTLVGYVEGATYQKDRMFDAYTKAGNAMILYSLIETEKASIQGRPMPFDSNDIVPLGFKVNNDGIYTIAIAAVDGIFSNQQTVYLRDKALNTVHDLSANPYTFTVNTGVYNDRFELLYQDETLGIDNIENFGIKVITNDRIVVRSGNEQIKEIQVFDMLGRKINQYQSVNANEFILNEQKSNQTLLLKIITENDNVTIKKILF